ncbi:CD63 antigen-like [Chrysoperla carnea]|uniref:CD63 antigen-like n=1 Tax=Chrysoperla carnea TaxID=189513 RepID=UPI001D09482D|nr:CD63 antigen-like [Chrysoperla carnea]XP_044734231.1 CD63 antigen-like [Chrysoperla carnea]
MVSGTMACVKYLLFCFNLLFVISGIAILSVGAIIEAAYSKYGDFVDASLSKPALILIIVGVIVLVVAFCGCCGAVRENQCMIRTFAVFLIVIFALELAAGIAGYLRKNDVESMLERKFNETMADYENNTEIQESWNVLQHDFACCGISGPEDWNKVFPNKTELPFTCCRDMPRNSSEKCTINYPTIVKDGCFEHLKSLVITNAYTLGGVGIGIALLQLIGVVCACSLAHSISREYETV